MNNTQEELRSILVEKYGQKYVDLIVEYERNVAPEDVGQMKSKQQPANARQHFTENVSIRIPSYKKPKTTSSVQPDPPRTSVYQDRAPSGNATCAFRVVYGVHKPGKKHKQWTHDGFILIENGNLTIYEEDGNKISGPRPVPFTRYEEGVQFLAGSREFEISTRLVWEDIKMGNFNNPRVH